jgi:glycosyltransferase involved in cell wall biosynthesis
VKILFLGDFEDTEIVPAPIKVGKELFKSFKNSGHHIFYLPYFQDGNIYSRIQKLFGFEKITGRVYRTGIFPLLFFVIKFRPQVVHLITPGLYYFSILPLKIFLDFKIIYSNHSIISIMIKKYLKITYYNKMRFKLIEKLAFKYSNKILVLSKLESRFLRIYLNVPRSKIDIINNGITPYSIKKKYDESSHTIKLITVGAIDRQEKGIGFLIKTLSQLNLGIELTTCNFEFQELSELKTTKNLSVIIKPPLNEIELRKEMLKNDLFIAPSEYEPFNISLLEAMSTGIIILASSRVGLTERFNPKLKNLVFQNGNTNDLIDRIKLYLKMNNVQKLSLSSEIINFAKNFYWENISKVYLKIYNDILKN